MKQSAGTHSKTRRTTHRIALAAVCAGLAASATFSVPNAAADAPSGLAARTETTIAIEALISQDAPGAASKIPSDFADDFAYSPVVEDGLLVNPAGECSSPIPLPAEFEPACTAHDLGYDLLRYGAARGSMPPAWARQGLDSRLATDMHAGCAPRTGIGSRTICHALAEVAAFSVRFNSWRQHNGTPVAEPALPFLIAGSAVAALLTAVLAMHSAAATRRTRPAVTA